MLIRKLRLDRGWSQEQLASMAGISTRTLQRAERGTQASLETLKCLAAVLEVDHTDLSPEAQMSTNLISDHERQALKYVDDLRGFYGHFSAYIITMACLVIVNIILTPQVIWVIWPAMGWGIGVAVHAMQTFQPFPFLGPEWEKRQIEKRLAKLRR